MEVIAIFQLEEDLTSDELPLVIFPLDTPLGSYRVNADPPENE